MIRTALTILAIELVLIGWVKWRYGARREELGRAGTQQPATGV
jgi:hypothetical protein